MFQFRRDSWVGGVLILSLALSMLGAGSLLHLTHHLPGDEEFEAPWECSQCKIAENSIGEFSGPTVCITPALTCEPLVQGAQCDRPFPEKLDATSPRAPPVPA